MSDETAEAWSRCSSCKKPLAFDADYYVCSVSTCNRKDARFRFCSFACWDAHMPIARHREAWAETERSPTQSQYEREQAAAPSPGAPRQRRTAPTRSAPVPAPPKPPAWPKPPETVIRRSGVSEAPKPDEVPPLVLNESDLPNEILVVVSKLKNYVRARSGMNTSDGLIGPLSAMLRRACDEAILNAHEDGRRTILDRDLDLLD